VDGRRKGNFLKTNFLTPPSPLLLNSDDGVSTKKTWQENDEIQMYFGEMFKK